jgi:hypothetical protein
VATPLIAAIGVVIDMMIATMIDRLAKAVEVDPGGGRGHGRGRRRTTPWVNTTCQICNKEDHTARDCFWRFQEDDDESDDKEVHAASYGVDTSWY